MLNQKVIVDEIIHISKDTNYELHSHPIVALNFDGEENDNESEENKAKDSKKQEWYESENSEKIKELFN